MTNAKEWTGGDYRKYNADKKYLHHYDLPDGEDLVVTIKTIRNEVLENKMKGTSEAKLVLYFEEDVKPLALNKRINPTSITKALGTANTSNWIGRRIALYVGNESRSDDGFAVRIRDYAPKVTEYICADCQAKIEDSIIAGKKYSGAAIANQSLTRFGRYLCPDCAAKAKEEHDGE